eukprot:scaffold206107_cov10-Tisochrysis_lutea.AAC.1
MAATSGPSLEGAAHAAQQTEHECQSASGVGAGWRESGRRSGNGTRMWYGRGAQGEEGAGAASGTPRLCDSECCGA